jgi:multidrug efflux pump subunit AcrB
MQFRTSLKWILGVAITVYAVSPAGAQTGGAGAGGGSASAGGSAAGTIGFKRKADLSPQEQLAKAQQSVARMAQSRAAVAKQLQTARRQRDAIKVTCLEDKVNQMDVTGKTAKQAVSDLSNAVRTNNAEAAGHHYTIVTIAQGRSDELTAAANQCIGEESAFVGATTVVTTITDVPPTEDGYPPTDPTLVSLPPFCTSCQL